jgi:hypothetical protein
MQSYEMFMLRSREELDIERATTHSYNIGIHGQVWIVDRTCVRNGAIISFPLLAASVSDIFFASLAPH